MRIFLLFALILISTVACGQEFSYPVIVKNGGTVNQFVPTGWRILDKVTGDLNKDKVKDVAVILQYKDSIKVTDTDAVDDIDTSAHHDNAIYKQPRILLILLTNPKNYQFYLAEQSDTFVMTNDDKQYMEDPYQGMTIKNGVFGISFGLSYSAGSWYITNTSYKFRYQQNSLTLIGANYFSMHRATGGYDNYSYNFLTQKRRLEKGNKAKNIRKVYWKSLHITPLKTLQSFTAPLTWEIEADVSL